MPLTRHTRLQNRRHFERSVLHSTLSWGNKVAWLKLNVVYNVTMSGPSIGRCQSHGRRWWPLVWIMILWRVSWGDVTTGHANTAFSLRTSVVLNGTLNITRGLFYGWRKATERLAHIVAFLSSLVQCVFLLCYCVYILCLLCQINQIKSTHADHVIKVLPPHFVAPMASSAAQHRPVAFVDQLGMTSQQAHRPLQQHVYGNRERGLVKPIPRRPRPV